MPTIISIFKNSTIKHHKRLQTIYSKYQNKKNKIKKTSGIFNLESNTGNHAYIGQTVCAIIIRY